MRRGVRLSNKQGRRGTRTRHLPNFFSAFSLSTIFFVCDSFFSGPLFSPIKFLVISSFVFFGRVEGRRKEKLPRYTKQSRA
jgi:hypothetical protein